MDANPEPSSSKAGKRKRQLSVDAHPPTEEGKSKKIHKAPATLPYPTLNVSLLTDSAQGRTRSSADTMPKVASHLQTFHRRLLTHHETVTRMLGDTHSTPLHRIKTLVAWYCEVEEVAPALEDPLLWKLIDEVAGMLCALGTSPDTFNPLAWPGILTPTTELELAESKGQMIYYIRTYSRPRQTASAEFKEYMELHPIDAPFSTSRMAISGMGTQATKTPKDVLRVCGFEGAEFEVEDVKNASLGKNIQEVYGGQTSRSPEKRKEDDEESKGGSRNTNFNIVADPTAVKLFVIQPWIIETDDALDWRRRQLLRDLERVLVFCLSSPLNSASGGGPPLHRPPQSVRHRMERVLASLPEKISSTPNLQLSEALAAQIDEEIKFFQHMRENNLEVGQQMCGAALEGVKRDLCDYIGTVNGHVIGVNVMKDITAKDFHGKISSGFFTPVMGRGMVLRWDMMEDVLRMDGEILSFATRRLLGPYLDVWRLILVHRWWGLLAIMMVILLGILDPLLVIGHSAPVAHLFYSHLLAQLPVDVQLHDSLDTQLLQHPRIKSLMPPQFP